MLILRNTDMEILYVLTNYIAKLVMDELDGLKPDGCYLVHRKYSYYIHKGGSTVCRPRKTRDCS